MIKDDDNIPLGLIMSKKNINSIHKSNLKIGNDDNVPLILIKRYLHIKSAIKKYNRKYTIGNMINTPKKVKFAN